MKRRFLCVCLLLAMVFGGQGAWAANTEIRFPIQVGMLYVGDSLALVPGLKNLKLSDLTWASTDSAVARMDGNRLTAVSEGIAIIGAFGGGANAVCGVVVLPRSISLRVGQTHALPNNPFLDYASADARVASIDASGVVTAKKAGTTLVGTRFSSTIGVVEVTVTDTPSFAQSAAAELDCANQTDQIVLVDYQGGSRANVSFHEKVNGLWTQLYATEGYVGAKGIGKTREGDQKTPSGTYNLTMAFGIQSDPGANLPYVKVTQYHYWCGTSGSEYYNQLVDTRQVDRAATSSDEVLIRYGGYYDYCLFIDYNASGEAGKGSCIFLHCTGGKSSTAGCIAIPEEAMKQAVRWVRPGAKIVIR